MAGASSVVSFESANISANSINATACAIATNPATLPTTVVNLDTSIFVKESFTMCGNLLVDASTILFIDE